MLDLDNDMDTTRAVSIPNCGICNKNGYKYVCPKCNILYCSLPCYKSQTHLDCSEAFYKESISEMLKSEKPNSESKRRMEEILKRVNNQEDESDYESCDSDDMTCMADRLKGIDLDDADSIWKHLTEEERNEFSEIVRNGDATKLIPKWEPWWTEKHHRPKVQFVDLEMSEPYKDFCPKMRQVQMLSSITRVEPSPLVLFNLINTIAGYTLVIRYYNGNFDKLVLEAATLLITLARNLCYNESYHSVELALASVSETATNCPWISVESENLSQMKTDTFDILEGPNEHEPDFYVRAALSDVHNLLTLAKKEKRTKKILGNFSKSFPETNENAINFVTNDVLSKCIKKVDFYESWTLEYFKTQALINN